MEINPDEKLPIAHWRKSSVARDVGHKCKPARIKAKRDPAAEAIPRISKHIAMMWENVIPEISTVHLENAFVLRPFFRGTATQSLGTGTALRAIRKRSGPRCMNSPNAVSWENSNLEQE